MYILQNQNDSLICILSGKSHIRMQFNWYRKILLKFRKVRGITGKYLAALKFVRFCDSKIL